MLHLRRQRGETGGVLDQCSGRTVPALASGALTFTSQQSQLRSPLALISNSFRLSPSIILALKGCPIYASVIDSCVCCCCVRLLRLDEHLEMHHLVFKAVQNIIHQHRNVRQKLHAKSKTKTKQTKTDRTGQYSSNPIQFTNSFSHSLLGHLKQPGNTLFKT